MRIFIGYDPRQPVAFHVAVQSLLEHASKPLSITPLVYETLPIEHQGLTPFTFSRFLVPWLCDYWGPAVFMDSDFMARFDITRLQNPGNAVNVVQHERKFERPSLMLFNCEQCKVLTPQFVNENFKSLMGLSWTDSIGSLDKSWNHLVGYDNPDEKAKLVHFTQGLPCFPETKGAEHAKEWVKLAHDCVRTASWEELMGSSVHAKYVRQVQK